MNKPFAQNSDRVLIAVNPKSGRKATRPDAERLAELLQQQGLHAELETDLDRITEAARQYHAQGQLRALVGVGGDGTAAELVNRTPPGLPITLFPAGNQNLLAGYLRLGSTAEAVCRTIVDGALVRLDAGKANDRVFLLMAGCGFDADVVRRVHARRKGRVSNRTYFKPILESIRSYEYPEFRVCWDRVHWDRGDTEARLSTSDARWLFALNLPCYAAGLPLAPEADARDGQLDVCTFGGGSIWHGLRYLAAVLRHRHGALADCTIRRAQRLEVTCDKKVPYQLDGDPGGFLPLKLEVLPDRLTMIVPRSETELPHCPVNE